MSLFRRRRCVRILCAMTGSVLQNWATAGSDRIIATFLRVANSSDCWRWTNAELFPVVATMDSKLNSGCGTVCSTTSHSNVQHRLSWPRQKLRCRRQLHGYRWRHTPIDGIPTRRNRSRRRKWIYHIRSMSLALCGCLTRRCGLERGVSYSLTGHILCFNMCLFTYLFIIKVVPMVHKSLKPNIRNDKITIKAEKNEHYKQYISNTLESLNMYKDTIMKIKKLIKAIHC